MSIMATIRWCPIFPKWDIYQPLFTLHTWGWGLVCWCTIMSNIVKLIDREKVWRVHSGWLLGCCRLLWPFLDRSFDGLTQILWPWPNSQTDETTKFLGTSHSKNWSGKSKSEETVVCPILKGQDQDVNRTYSLKPLHWLDSWWLLVKIQGPLTIWF